MLAPHVLAVTVAQLAAVALSLPIPPRIGPTPEERAARFPEVLERVAAARAVLLDRFRAARTARERTAVRREARAFIERTLTDDIFPAWMGMPSGGGPTALATMPHQPGMSINCSGFVTAALQNAGLVLQSRARFVQAPALWIQRALLPPGRPVHRYGTLSADELRARLVADLGDGIYVVGLDIHVGFLVIRGQSVSFVHSSYTDEGVVVEAPVMASLAIAFSRRRGYWVSPLFQDDRLIDMWLRKQPVPAPPAWKPGMKWSVEMPGA